MDIWKAHHLFAPLVDVGEEAFEKLLLRAGLFVDVEYHESRTIYLLLL